MAKAPGGTPSPGSTGSGREHARRSNRQPPRSFFTIFPDLVEPGFRKHHERLHAGAYLDFYRKRCESVESESDLLRFLPLDLLIDGPSLKAGTSKVPARVENSFSRPTTRCP